MVRGEPLNAKMERPFWVAVVNTGWLPELDWVACRLLPLLSFHCHTPEPLDAWVTPASENTVELSAASSQSAVVSAAGVHNPPPATPKNARSPNPKTVTPSPPATSAPTRPLQSPGHRPGTAPPHFVADRTATQTHPVQSTRRRAGDPQATATVHHPGRR